MKESIAVMIFSILSRPEDVARLYVQTYATAFGFWMLGDSGIPIHVLVVRISEMPMKNAKT